MQAKSKQQQRKNPGIKKAKTSKARIQRTNIRKRRRRRQTMPLATRKAFKKKFKTLNQSGTSVRVTGRDLLYTIPDNNTAPIQNTQVITVIPANPLYWKGTRISALAQGYQNYRPILFKVTYVPIVSAMQSGNVIGGSIWDGGIVGDNIQQSLRTSNGGFLTQCFVPQTATVRPKSNLQFNLYRLTGDFNQESNPFLYIALAIGCRNSSDQRIVPGYFYVTWTYEFKNPIGNNQQSYNSGLITYQNLTQHLNTTIINLKVEGDVPFGAYIQHEKQSEIVNFYNGTTIEIQNTEPIWAFANITPATVMASNKIPIYYTSLTTENTITVTIPSGSGRVENLNPVAVAYASGDNYIIKEYDSYTKYEQFAQFTYTDTISSADVKFIITDPQQAFGIYQSSNSVTVNLGTLTTHSYTAPKSKFILTLASNNNSKPVSNKVKANITHLTNKIENISLDENIE